MRRKINSLIIVALMLLVGCTTTPVTPRPTWTPVPTATAVPTLTPTPTQTPTPTPTPIPPMVASILWPERVSAMEPAVIAVDVVQPYDVRIPINVSATVMDPASQVYGTFDLQWQDAFRYAADAPLRLPFDPLPGLWWLIVHIETGLPVTGERALYFEPTPIDFRVLTDTLPVGVTMRVPEAFDEVMALGDQWAGARAWEYDDGEVALWWAPGPTEDLLLNNAIVMVETTHDDENPPEVLGVAQIEWQGRAAFLFQEMWHGNPGGPSEAWVIQGENFWLYVLRVRALEGESIPLLVREVGATFAFAD